MPTLVPNAFPKLPHPLYRLAIVGEAPGVEEEVMRQPFVGPSGRLLRHVLSTLRISAEQCFVGNVAQSRPEDNDIDNFAWDGPEITQGLAALQNDLHTYQPNCTLLLGRSALKAFCPQVASQDDKGNLSWSIFNYRGSILSGRESGLLPAARDKVVAAYHPAYIQRSYGDRPYFKFDLQRAVKQSAFPEIRVCQRSIQIRPTVSQVEEYIATIRSFQRPAGFDVEGWNDNVGITMCSIAPTPTDCLVIPFWLDGRNYWTEEEEVRIWSALTAWLTDPTCAKIVTNAAYEQFILAWKHNICIVNITEDTMLKHWEIFPELEKSLAVQCSLYTEEPYYKHERNSDTSDGKLLYNGKDSCVTTESSDAQEGLLLKVPTSYSHYRFNISILPAMQYLMLRGCKLDPSAIAEHVAKNTADLGELTTRIQDELGRPFNPKSVKDKQWLLYDHLGYSPYVRYGTTTKEEVMLRYYARDRDPLLKLVITAVGLRTRLSDIKKLTTDTDGRIRSSYNLVGTPTARLTSSASNAMVAYFTKTGILKWDQTGTNLQNVTKELRNIFIPDGPDFAFWSVDLSGADAWTVACDLAALGSSTMLDDLTAGIRPAKVLLLMLWEHEAGRSPASINSLSRAELKARTKAIKFPEGRDAQNRPADWQYLCMKRVQHGTNYGMEPDKLSATIFKDSDGLIDLTAKEAGIYQYLYKLRYNPKARTDWITRELAEKGTLQSAAGVRRKFFNLRNPRNPDPDVVRSALSFEPQVNTTFVTNSALRNLWYDRANRTKRDSLFCEPLLHIHDALAGQFKRSYKDWAVERLREWFRTELVIHGVKVAIPSEGGVGRDWLNCKDEEF